MGFGGRSRVAIVIVTRDRCQTLLKSLDHLAALGEGHRVVVVDNGSTDGTLGMVSRRHPQVLLLPLEHNLGSAARTAGAAAVEEPYVALCDDDSWWAPGSLARAERVLDDHPALGLIAGRVLIGDAEREDPTCRLMSGSPLPRHPGQAGAPVLGFLACAAVFRRSAYLEAGGFHPNFGVGGEETLLSVDLASTGWQLAYVPEVVAHHHPPPRPDSAARRRRQARNSLWLTWLRRPLPGALRQTAGLIHSAFKDPAVARGLADAVAGGSWVFRERRPVGHDLERGLRALGDSI
ncbi:MAG: glycosyl transferase [Candidatus Nephthysia bennettiae]|uniref:Glycosyltransferase n=1 Tax=Candidatus Nephthysia bennettiae TaxID=3127016 RepID=A0A934KG53_9BACT|nr:glycosyltransferase [Candidatus Dormibacteraeota bacterium]MBJ7611019.1 glycosyltransferase [Candidatus Dormibacteraeota bacterium]PZR86395.1 MAG: glycosyl transferase [Candidatus Dormibacteraeota bacterium]